MHSLEMQIHADLKGTADLDGIVVRIVIVDSATVRIYAG